MSGTETDRSTGPTVYPFSALSTFVVVTNDDSRPAKHKLTHTHTHTHIHAHRNTNTQQTTDNRQLALWLSVCPPVRLSVRLAVILLATADCKMHKIVLVARLSQCQPESESTPNTHTHTLAHTHTRTHSPSRTYRAVTFVGRARGVERLKQADLIVCN